MQDILTIAAGVILAFLFMELLSYAKEAPRRAHQRRQHQQLENSLREMADDVIKGFEKARAAEVTRKKPATKKAPVKKPVAKKAPTTKKPVTKKGN